MKEREIVERLAPLFDPQGSAWISHQQGSKHLLGVPLADIAKALGVEVEPDEPALPDKVSFLAEPRAFSISWGGRARYIQFSFDAHLTSDEVLIFQAAFKAYNERPRWHDVAQRPPSPGQYLVRRSAKSRHIGINRGKAQVLEANWDGGGWNTIDVTGWMPLPSP